MGGRQGLGAALGSKVGAPHVIGRAAVSAPLSGRLLRRRGRAFRLQGIEGRGCRVGPFVVPNAAVFRSAGVYAVLRPGVCYGAAAAKTAGVGRRVSCGIARTGPGPSRAPLGGSVSGANSARVGVGITLSGTARSLSVRGSGCVSGGAAPVA